MTRVAVIGCGDAGLSAAFAAVKQGAKVTVISDERVYYPRCPLPYYIGGKIKRKDLVAPLEAIFKGSRVKVVFDRALEIKDGTVICEKGEVPFDKAIIATGGRPKRIGNSLTLRTMADADEIKRRAKTEKPVIIGGGMLGCELADVLGGRIIEVQDRILPNFDPEFSAIIERLLRKRADIKTGTTKIPESGFMISAIGVIPESGLAERSGIETSEFGIKVDNRLETSMPDVYAAGDCIEEKCFFTKKSMHSYLGPQAERQGVIAGTNAAGGDMRYEGSLNAVVAKICGCEIGVAGMCGADAKKRGIETTWGVARTKTKPEYDKTAEDLMIKMHFSGERLVGCQAIGGEAVDGIINLASYAMRHGATVDDLINMTYCFSPPVCSAPNPIISCAENAKRRMRR